MKSKSAPFRWIIASGLVCSAIALVARGEGEQPSPAPSPTPSTSESKRPTLREILESWIPGVGADDEASDSNSNSDAAGGLPTSMEGISFSPSDVLSAEDLAHALPWRPPTFAGQKGALGWNDTVFEVPEGLRARVNFWKDIYSKYTTDQGVMHDTIHIEIVYGPVDFTSIMKDSGRNIYQKARAREKLVDEKRKEIVERLKRLNGRTGPDGLAGEDLRVWKMFEHIKDPAKFLDAAEKGRVRFQLGQKDKFLLGIYYSGRYLRDMERIFREQGLPIELTRLPFVESSFNIFARSRVGASGVWQFMPRTAKPYMKVGKDIDERNDPLKATLASARVLKQNYLMLQAWPLAVTGYNHGPYGVRGIVNKLGTRDLAEIIRRYSSRTFGFASENFYSCFLAALEVERNAKKYFGDAKWSPEIESAELKVTKAMPFKTLVEFFDGNEEMAGLLNPHLTSKTRSGRGQIPKGTYMRVPPARLKIAQDFMAGKLAPAKLASSLQAVPIPKATPLPALAQKEPEPGVAPESTPRVRLEQVSATANAVLPALGGRPAEAANASGTVTSSAPPTPVPGTSTPTAAVGIVDPNEREKPAIVPAVADASAKPKTHRVRAGENLTKIAKKYGIDLKLLKRANKLDERKGRKQAGIRTGQVLVIPEANASEDQKR